MPNTAWTTPRAISAETGKDIKVVHAWICSGSLLAYNLAERVGERPRYKVRLEDWEAFLRHRQVQPPTPRPKRRRGVQRSEIPEYV